MKIVEIKEEGILNKAGLKKTEARLHIVQFLLKSKKPNSPQIIFEKLQKEGIDKVTVYRTLESLEKKGLVKRVNTGEREAQYELTDTHEDHHHIICLNCKKVSDFTGCDAEHLIQKAMKQVKDFSSVSHHSFDIFGICNSCAKK
ncbi:MAG: Fur family transcriptional regulator [Patescibacteria group bacterium]